MPIGLTTGPLIDIKNGYDLLTKQGQDDTWDITHAGSPTIVLVAPGCTSWSALSNTLSEEERARRRTESYPFVEFCADVATYQRQLGRYFIIENAESSQMWGTAPFQQIADQEGVERSTVHMCAYGLKDPVSGTAMKKPMSFLHNTPMKLFS